MNKRESSVLPETFEFIPELEGDFQLKPILNDEGRFTRAELYIPSTEGVLAVNEDIAEISNWGAENSVELESVIGRLIKSVSSPRISFAGLSLDHPILMGVVNITPDSFHDGGRFTNHVLAVAHAKKLLNSGAEILDIGGESTRPGADPISEQEEIDRIAPVIEGLVDEKAVISVDTRKAGVMRVALSLGAKIVNDVSALSDIGAIEAVKKAKASAILMHMQGIPKTMQRRPNYFDPPYEIANFLSRKVALCERAGIPRDRLAIDPGIGFGKLDHHNFAILNALPILHGIGVPIVIGVSRKSFIGRFSGTGKTKDRLAGTISATLHAISQGVQIHRVHDVAAIKQALTIWERIKCG